MSKASTSDHVVDLAVLGTVVRVLLEDPADRGSVETPWHLCLMGSESRDVPEPQVVTLRATDNDRARLSALTTLTQDVTRAAIRAQTGHLLMLHAGALSNLETGATVAYVAPGGTGKTTLTTTLGRGRGYITDETVGVTRRGEIKPYPKPLSVRRSGGGGKDEVAPGDLSLRPAMARPWLARLLVVRRDPEHVGAPLVRPMGLLDGIATVSPETSALAALREPLRTCQDIVERVGGVLHVTFREAIQVEPLLAEGLEADR